MLELIFVIKRMKFKFLFTISILKVSGNGYNMAGGEIPK